MKSALLLFFILPLLFTVEVKEEDDVVILTDSTFDEFVNLHPFVLVEFYAPWCGHCKKLAPEYSKAAKKLKEQNSNVFLAKVDSTVEKAAAEKQQVKGYPTLKFFVNGVASEYTGGRTEEEIVLWLSKKTGPSTQEFSDKESLAKFVNDNEVVVIFFGDKESAQFKTFESFTKSADDYLFGHSFDSEVREANNAQANTIVLFKQFDEKRNDYGGSFDVEEIKHFVTINSLPTIIKFDQKAAQKIFGENKETLFLFIKENDEKSNEIVKVLEESSTALKGKILLSISQIVDGIGKRLGDYIGVTEEELPSIKIVNPNGGETKKFQFEGEFTSENLIKFYDDYANNRLKSVYKSAPIPETNDEPVKIVVGKNFQDIVLDPTKDVLLEFYAPWCGHCKSLAPIYDALAQKLLVNPNIILAKIDATANEIEGIPIQGFPTLKFFPSNAKNPPKDYSGERNEEGLIKFLKEHGTVSWIDLDGAPTPSSTEEKKIDL